MVRAWRRTLIYRVRQHAHPISSSAPARPPRKPSKPCASAARRPAHVGRRRRPAALSASAAVQEISWREPSRSDRLLIRHADHYRSMPWTCGWVSPAVSIDRAAQRVEIADGVARRVRQACCWRPAAGRGCCRCPAPNWPASTTCAPSPTSTGCGRDASRPSRRHHRRRLHRAGGRRHLPRSRGRGDRARSRRPRHEPRGLAGGVGVLRGRARAAWRRHPAAACGCSGLLGQRIATPVPQRVAAVRLPMAAKCRRISCWLPSASSRTTRWRAPPGSSCDDGILVDEHCRTSDPAHLGGRRLHAPSQPPLRPARAARIRGQRLRAGHERGAQHARTNYRARQGAVVLVGPVRSQDGDRRARGRTRPGRVRGDPATRASACVISSGGELIAVETVNSHQGPDGGAQIDPGARAAGSGASSRTMPSPLKDML